MKTLTQTKFGETDGNCFATCLASIFEDEDIPYISISEDWWDEGQEYVSMFGYEMEYIESPYIEPEGYSIVVGTTNRGSRHCCVAFDGKIVHDPHPSRTGLEADPEYFIALEPLI